MTTLRPHGPLLLLFLLAACGDGPDDAAAGADAAPPRDTLVRRMERPALTGDDLVGFDRAEVELDLPWSSNRVARTTGATGRGTLRSVDVTPREAFDRVLFTMDAPVALPTYRVRFVEEGDELTCSDRPLETDVPAGRLLAVTFQPAQNRDGQGAAHVPVRLSDLDGRRLGRGGLVCADGRTLTWVAAVTADELRVIELREPRRLAVDVR